MKGYVALTTVLILVPLLLLTGINLVYDNLTSLIVAKMDYDSQVLKTNSETCLEESVYRIKRNMTFTGGYSITKIGWNCDVNISDKSGYPGVKIINIVAIDDNGSKISLDKELNTNSNPFELTNVQ